MRELTQEIRDALKTEVYTFIAEESDLDVEELRGDMSIMDDLDGDSLMFVELVESLKKKYDLDVQLQVVGKYLLKRPAETVDEVVETLCLVYQYENDIVDLERQ